MHGIQKWWEHSQLQGFMEESTAKLAEDACYLENTDELLKVSSYHQLKML